MTMTFPLLKLSKKIAILVTGEEKCSLLHTLGKNHCDDYENYPICKVALLTDQVTWFINNSCDIS